MTAQRTAPEHLDLIIIGAGISGIGAARSVSTEQPGKSIAVLEGRQAIGGTWDLFRYPGIRSDSDLHTFGYEFKPWRHESAIADAPLIREYLDETVEENGLDQYIRFGHQVRSASWSSEQARWTLQVDVVNADGETVEQREFTANWVLAGTGYYRYDEGYSPEFPGRAHFQGDVIHPQHWPEGYDYAGKRVVVIGSGATAITMVPAMATGDGAAAHVTMLQRTPTYIMSLPRIDGMAVKLTKLFGEQRGYQLTRTKNIWLDWVIVHGLRRFPNAGRRLIRSLTAKALPPTIDVDRHFNPPYNPWDQRLCVAPDGDFFATLREGHASVETDEIQTFTENGVLLASGKHLDADVIVTATGLNLRLFGGIELTVDGERVDLSDTVAYRGMLLSGVPNWAMAIGYTTSSWTLKVSLMCRYFNDLLRHMDAYGYDTAVARTTGPIETRPVMDISAGYAKRAEGLLPRQGTAAPWRMAMGYQEDEKLLRGPVADEFLHLAGPSDRAHAGAGVGRAPARKAAATKAKKAAPTEQAPLATTTATGGPNA